MRVYTLLSVLFLFYAKPGYLYDIENKTRYLLQCSNTTDNVTPCDFKLKLEPGEYIYINKTGEDKMVLEVENDTIIIKK